MHALLRRQELDIHTIDGLPAHILFVHVVVVLAPLTAVLGIAAAVSKPIRSRLVWLIAVSAAAVAIATPLTTDAGEWLEERVPSSPVLDAHTELGDTLLFFAGGLCVVAAALVWVHLRERPGSTPQRWLSIATVVLAVVVGVGTVVQVYRIGDSGARASWADYAQSAPRDFAEHG